MKYVRIFADADGESHFEDVGLEFSPAAIVPSTPPLHVSRPQPATGVIFLTVLEDWLTDFHPAPQRQFFFIMSGEGELEVTTSDGEKRIFKAGDVLLVDDTTGKGHKSTIRVGDGENLAVIVPLPN